MPSKKITFGFSESDKPKEIKKLKKYKTRDNETLTFFAKEEGDKYVPFATYTVTVDGTEPEPEPTQCPPGQHYDDIQGKCVPDIIIPPPNDDEFVNRFSFVGDLDIDDDPNAQKKVDFIKSTGTKFFANGDYYADVDGSGDITKFTQVFDQLKPITVITTKGNHDDEEDGSSKVATAMNEYFGWSPIAASKYVSEDGKYAIVGMDTQDSNISKQDGQQYTFVKNTLESDEFKNALYRFVVVHKNLVSAEGKHANLDDVREVYHPLFTANKVSLVIQAHDHNMAISKLIDGVTYIVNGAGGRSHYAIGENPATIEWSNDSTYGLGLIREHKTDANKIQIKFVDFNGKLIHSKVLNFGPVVEPPTCPPGQHLENGVCVPDVVEPEPCPPGQHRDPATGECVPDIVTPPPSGEFPIPFTEFYNSKQTLTQNGIYESGKYIDEILLSSGASGVDNHQIKDGWLIINSGGGNGRVYWDFHRTNNKAVEQLPDFGHKFVFYGTFKMGGDNLSIKFGNHGSDGREYDGQYIFGGLGCSLHATEAQSKAEYWHNVQGDEEAFEYPNGLRLETGKEYKFFLTIDTDYTKNEVSLKLWIDFANGNGWTQVIQNRVWNKSKWNPPSNPPQGKDTEDVKAGPVIKCHTIWTRANEGNSQVKDIGWGMPL